MVVVYPFVPPAFFALQLISQLGCLFCLPVHYLLLLEPFSFNAAIFAPNLTVFIGTKHHGTYFIY